MQWFRCFQGYGGDVSYNEAEYKKAKEQLQIEKPNIGVCYEDVLLKILQMGFKLNYKDGEDEDLNCSINMQDVYDRLPLTPISNLTNLITENDDATDADCVLQTVFLKEVIFG